MLSKVTAKNVGDVFLRHTVIFAVVFNVRYLCICELNAALFYGSLLFLVNYHSHLMSSATFCLQKFGTANINLALAFVFNSCFDIIWV